MQIMRDGIPATLLPSCYGEALKRSTTQCRGFSTGNHRATFEAVFSSRKRKIPDIKE
jgi:hypothetical protein